jgi:hypothetical protein
MLTQMGQGFMPMASGIDPARRTGLEGVPLLGGGGGPISTLAGVAMAPYYRQMMGQIGMTPMGLGHDQNVYDVLRSMQFMQMQQQAVSVAAQSDRANYMRTFEGMAALTGTPFGAEQRRAAGNLAGAMVAMSPMLTEVMPDLMDQMGGMRGSSAVLARRMMEGGRYRIDPVTGRMGMSAESTGMAARRLYEDLYSDENVAQMHGVSAGRLGSLMQELQSRGMLSTRAAEPGYRGFASGDVRGEVQRAIDDLRVREPGVAKQSLSNQGISGTGDKLTVQDLDKLMLDPAVADRMRSFDVDRLKRSLKGYTQAVAAMRDIFGDAGRPDAPMSELMRGLEAMTMGSSAQLDPGRLSTMVRQTYNLAKQSGVSMDNMMVMQQHAAQRAAAMGLEPVFGAYATQGSLAFGGAYRAQGHGAHTAWGAMSADQLQQADSNLRVQAAGSQMSNRLSLLMRINDRVGGFQDGSEADKMVQSVLSGTPSSITQMSDSQFINMLQGAKTRSGTGLGLTENDIRIMNSQRDTNREMTNKYNTIIDLTRRAQGDEIWQYVGVSYQQTMTSQLAKQMQAGGMGSSEAYKAAQEMSRAVSGGAMERIRNLSTASFADTATRNTAIGKILEEEMQAKGYGPQFANMNAEQKKLFFENMADMGYGNANRDLRRGTFANWQNMQNVHRLTNVGTLNEADRASMQASFDARMQDSMSPLGRGTMLQRAVDALQDTDPNDPNSFLKVLGSALGGVRNEDLNQAMLKPLISVRRKQDAIRQLQAQVASETDPKKRAELIQRLDVLYKELTAESGSIAKLGEQFGLGTGGVSAAEVTRASNANQKLGREVADLVGIQTGLGQLPQVPTNELIDDTQRTVLKETGENISREQATDLASARARAQAIGISGDDVRKETKGKGWEAQRDAIERLLDKAGERAYTPAQAEARKQRFAAFFNSEDGDRFRRTVADAGEEAESVATRLIDNPASVKRLGLQALEMSTDLRESQQRLRELARYYTGGDLARLQAGDLNLDMTNERDREAYKRVTGEVGSIRERQQGIYDRYRAADGSTNRQFELGDEATATREVMRKAGYSEAQIEQHIKKSILTKDQQDAVAKFRSEMGSETAARRTLGISTSKPDSEVSDWERVQIAAVRFGKGSRQEIAAAMGGAWYTLDGEQGKQRIEQLRKGVGSREAAIKALGIERGNRTDAEWQALLREKDPIIRAAMYGFGSEDHAARVAGVEGLSMTDAQKAIREQLKYGTTSEAYARQQLKMSESSLDPRVKAFIQRRREEMGDSREATRLMGKDLSKMTAAERQEHAKLTGEIGVARRLTPMDEALLERHQRSEKLSDQEKKDSAEWQKDEQAVTRLMKDIGLRTDQRDMLYGGNAALQRMGEAGKKMLNTLYGSSEGVVRDLLTEYGMQDPGGTLTASQSKLASLFDTTAGRGLALHMLSSRQTLKKFGAKFAGVDENSQMDSMRTDYMAAIETQDRTQREAKIAEFQRKAGISSGTEQGQREWTQLQNALQFETQMGFAKYGKGRALQSDDQLLELAEKAVRGEQARINQDGRATNPGSNGPIEVTGKVSGTLHITGDKADVAMAFGGDRNHTVPA